jgi:hypothetical protein
MLWKSTQSSLLNQLENTLMVFTNRHIRLFNSTLLYVDLILVWVKLMLRNLKYTFELIVERYKDVE